LNYLNKIKVLQPAAPSNSRLYMKGKNAPNKSIVPTSTSKSLTEKLKDLYSSQNTLPKLIEDEKIKAQSLILCKITDTAE